MASVGIVIQTYLSRVLGLFFPMRHWLGLINAKNLQKDFWAGLTGVAMVLPQGIAFALIAGLPPEFGLYSAIVVQVIAGLFGSSWHMVTGPTVALSIVIPGIIAPYAVIGSPQYIGLTLTLMFLVGVIQLLFGLFRFGSLVNFISHTVIIGFTAGAGLLIILAQLKTFTGIRLPSGLSPLETLLALQAHWQEFHYLSIFIASVTLVSALLLRKFKPRWPGMLLGLLIGALVNYLLAGAEKGVDMLGVLPASMPQMTLPYLSFPLITNLLPSAFALALLGLIEAVSIARSIAIRSHQRIDGNQEFFGQGLANAVGSCFSCYVGSGSFNRSAINYDAGAKTPIALMITSGLILLILIFIPQITRHLPMPAVAGALMLAGYNLFDLKQIKIIAKTSRNELTIILVTFLSTLLLNLEFAIYVGVILSLVFYLQKISRPVVSLVDFSQVYEKDETIDDFPLTALRIDGSLFFGSIDHVQNRMIELSSNKEWRNVVILSEGVNQLDIAGIEFLLTERNKLRKRGGDLYIIGMKSHVRNKLRASPYWAMLAGSDNLFESTYIAFRKICKRLGIENYRQYMKHLFKDYNRL